MPESNYKEEVQKLGLGAQVTLYEVDLTPLGGPVEYFTPMNADGTEYTAVSFGGQAYTPFPIAAEGFEWISGQAPPQPKVSIANIEHALTGYVLQYDHLIGAQFRRIRTFERFLDEGVEPDGLACAAPDIFRFERKTLHNDTMIQWEMASWIDQQGVQLPKRIVLRDYCDLAYRVWDDTANDFDYSRATCPYSGAGYFDRFGNATTAENDFCPHTLAGCRKRFGNAPLPMSAFPGVPKFRV